jgi:TPR repeat protein
MYLLGQGCEQDEEEAQRWFMDALEAFQRAEATAQKKGYLRYRIGKCHAYGHGTVQNYEESARWFRQAEEENNPFASYSLGGQYLRGQGVEQSDEEAFNNFYKAAAHAKQPNAYAQYQLGRMYRDGVGTEADAEASRAWFARAYAGFLAMEETMADDRLYYRLGTMNMTGTGTETDLDQARSYFEKAAELGNKDALYSLGKLYLNPEFSGYDPAKAVEYLELAVEEGQVTGIPVSMAFVSYEEDGTPYVWAEDRGHLEKRHVTLGSINDMLGTVDIVEGLTEEDYIAYPDPELGRPGAATTRNAPVEEEAEPAMEGEVG